LSDFFNPSSSFVSLGKMWRSRGGVKAETNYPEPGIELNSMIP